MGNLEWFRTDEITAEDTIVYNEVKTKSYQYLNTDFELGNDRDVDYNSFEELQM